MTGAKSRITYFLNICQPFLPNVERLKVGIGNIFQECLGREKKDSGPLRN